MDKELKILILEDSPADAELAERNLEINLKSMNTKVVDSEEGFIEALNNYNPDLIISDYKLPAFDGLSALHITKEISPTTPFVLFTGSQNEDIAVECMKAGADDYVIKEQIKRLAPAALGAIEKKKNEQERMITQQALLESKEKYQNLFENALIGVGISDSSGRILESNKLMREITGYTLEDFSTLVLGNTYVNPQDRIRFLEIMKRDGEVENFEVQLTNKEGIPYWAILSSKSIIFEGADAFLTTVLDITARKQTEEMLKESETKYRNLFSQIVDPVFIYDKETSFFLNCNQSAVDRYGYTLEDLTNMKSQQLHPPDEKEKVIENIMNTEDNSPNRYTHVTKDGQILQVEINSGPIIYEGREAWISIVRDITAREKAETNLLKNQYYLTKAQEIGKMGTWELDIQEDILRWTEENYRIFGVPPGSDMNLERFLDIVHPEDRKFVADEFNASLNHAPYDIEHRIIVNDQVKWVREKADIEFDEDGSPRLAIGFAQDITKQKQSEPP